MIRVRKKIKINKMKKKKKIKMKRMKRRKIMDQMKNNKNQKRSLEDRLSVSYITSKESKKREKKRPLVHLDLHFKKRSSSLFMKESFVFNILKLENMLKALFFELIFTILKERKEQNQTLKNNIRLHEIIK